jgi:hypothetical protein
MSVTTTQNSVGRPRKGVTKLLFSTTGEVAEFFSSESERTGKPKNRLLADMVKQQKTLPTCKRAYAVL